MGEVIAQLREGRTLVALLVGSGSPTIVEMAGDLGFRVVAIDARNGPVSPYSHQLEGLARAARAAGSVPFVIVPESTPGTINRALNDGAHAVIVPGVEGVDDALAAVRAGRYPPRGERGANPVVRAAQYGIRPWDDYWADSNDLRGLFCSLESRTAVAATASICDIADLDGVVLDLYAIALDTGTTDVTPLALPHVAEAVREARRLGKVCGVLAYDAAAAEEWVRAGCNLVILGSDVAAAAREMRSAFEALSSWRA